MEKKCTFFLCRFGEEGGEMLAKHNERHTLRLILPTFFFFFFFFPPFAHTPPSEQFLQKSFKYFSVVSTKKKPPSNS